MTVQAQKVEKIRHRIAAWRDAERAATRRGTRARAFAWRALRYAAMLQHEFVRDDVHIRAESLSYLMIFSLLPLIAGGFFFLTVFTQLSMVQEAIANGVDGLLENIPADHRDFVLGYVLQFKDNYLASIEGKSGSVGIFALAILVWVGLKVFSNIDQMINAIWSAEKNRPWLEQFRNFVVVSVVAPTVIIAGLSLPLVLNRLPVTHFLFVRFPLLATLFNFLLPSTLLFATFWTIYRFVPLRDVPNRAAALGALFATILLQVANEGMRIYFRFGTNGAYGKAAAIPLIAFWIYIMWTIVILGAEVSFLCVEGEHLTEPEGFDPSLRDGEALFRLLSSLQNSFETGAGPQAKIALRRAMGISPRRADAILQRSVELRWVAKTAPGDEYLLARSLQKVPLRGLLAQFFGIGAMAGDENPRSLAAWQQVSRRWLEAFGETDVFSWLQGGQTA